MKCIEAIVPPTNTDAATNRTSFLAVTAALSALALGAPAIGVTLAATAAVFVAMLAASPAGAVPRPGRFPCPRGARLHRRGPHPFGSAPPAPLHAGAILQVGRADGGTLCRRTRGAAQCRGNRAPLQSRAGTGPSPPARLPDARRDHAVDDPHAGGAGTHDVGDDGVLDQADGRGRSADPGSGALGTSAGDRGDEM